jgi:hypothetical protein
VSDRLEGALAPGEEVLFDRYARGGPPLGSTLGCAGALLGLVLLPSLLLVALAVAQYEAPRTWSFGWQVVQVHDGSGTLTTSVPGPLWGPESPLLPGVPIPYLLLVAAAAGAFHLLRLGRWRSTRSVVTTGRVLVSRGLVRPRFAVTRRTGAAEAARVVPGGVRIDGLVAPVVLPGLGEEDLEPVRLALGRYGPVSAGPPPPPWSWRELAGAALALVAVVLATTWVVVAPGRLEVRVARSSGGPTTDVLRIDLDSPAWGGWRADLGPRFGSMSSSQSGTGWGLGPDISDRRVPVRVRADAAGAPLVPAGSTVAWSGGLARQTVDLAFELPASSAPLHVEGRVRLERGDEVPFTVDLAPGGAVTVDLTR